MQITIRKTNLKISNLKIVRKLGVISEKEFNKQILNLEN
jgi:hypothetical protein